MAVSAWARVWKTERQTSSATRGRELAKAQPLPPCKPKVLTLRIRTDRGAASFYRGSLGDSATIFRGPVSDRDRARGQRMAAGAAKGNHLRKRLRGEGHAETRPGPFM